MSAINLKSITGITSITTPAGVDNQLTLHTNNTTERFRIDSSGRLMVGNTAASSFNASVNQFVLGNGVGNQGMVVYTGASHAGSLIFNDVADGTFQGGLSYKHGSGANDNSLKFYANAGERLRIKSDGDVLIGTQTAASKLTVDTGGNATADYISVTSGGTGRLKLGYAFTGGPSNDDFAEILTDTNGDLDIATRGNNSSQIKLFTSTGSGSVERLRIRSNGHIAAGTQAAASGAVSGGLALMMSKSDGARIKLCRDASGVGSSDGFELVMAADDRAYVWNRENADMLFGTNGTERLRISNDGTVSKYHNTVVQAAFGGTGQINGITATPSMAGVPFVVGRDTGSLRSAHFAGHLKFDSGYGLQGTEFEVYGNTSGLYLNSLVSGDAIIFKTHNGSSVGERLRIDSDGDVSIGSPTNSGSNRLQIVDSHTEAYVNSTDSIFRIINENTSADTNQASISFTCGTTGVGADSAIVSQAENSSGNSNLQFWTDTSNGMSEKLRIDSNGDINLGNNPTNQYGYKLNIEDSAIIYAQTASSGGLEAKWHLDNSAQLMEFGTVTTDDLALVTNNVPRLRITSDGKIGISRTPTQHPLEIQHGSEPTVSLWRGSTKGAALQAQSGGTYLYSYENAPLIFSVNSAQGFTERLRIDSSGNITTGGATPPNHEANYGSVFLKSGGTLGWLGTNGSFTFNAYYNGGWRYTTNAAAHLMWGSSDGINFSLASSGTAGNTVSFSRAMKIHTNNRISIGDGNSGTPLGALHINTKAATGTDTALFIGDNANKRFMVVNQVSNAEQFSEMKLQFNDNGTRSVLKLSNPYAPAGYGTAILFQGYNDGQQGMIYCQSEGANNANATLSLSSTGAFLHGNSNKHVTMPHQPSFAAYQAQSVWTVSGTMAFNSTRHNVGNHYNTSNGRFTAPVSGSYQFNFYSIYRGNHTSGWVSLYKNNSRMIGGDTHFTYYDLGSNWDNVSFSQVLYLNASDYVEMKSAQSTDWHGNNWQCFSGYLLG